MIEYNYSFLSVLYPSISIFLFGFFVLTIFLKSPKLAFIVSFVKAFIFFIYFYSFFDGTFTFLDDVKYLNDSLKFIYDGKTFLELVQNPLELIYTFGHFHFLYYLYNIVTIEIFGEYYFSPIAMNVMLTFLTAVILYKLLFLLNFTKDISKTITIIYLLHWDIVAWSSIVNFKDFLVQFFTIFIIYLLIKNDIKFRLYNILLIIFSILLLTFLRFYIPYFILFSFLLYKFFVKYRNTKKNKFIYLNFVFIFLTFSLSIIFFQFQDELNLFLNNFTNPFIGLVRYLITPLPFHMEDGYGFLIFSSLIDFLLLPIFIYGIYSFIKIENQYKYFIIIYFMLILLFYGSFIELQGPRHRIQILPYIVIFQSIGILYFLKKLNYRRLKYAKNNISY